MLVIRVFQLANGLSGITENLSSYVSKRCSIIATYAKLARLKSVVESVNHRNKVRVR